MANAFTIIKTAQGYCPVRKDSKRQVKIWINEGLRCGEANIVPYATRQEARREALDLQNIWGIKWN